MGADTHTIKVAQPRIYSPLEYGLVDYERKLGEEFKVIMPMAHALLNEIREANRLIKFKEMLDE